MTIIYECGMSIKPVYSCIPVPDIVGFNPPSGIWLKPIGNNINVTNGLIAIAVDSPDPLPLPDVSSQCATGISFPQSFPSSLQIINARVGRGNSDNIINTFVELEDNGEKVFNFEVDNNIKESLVNGTLNPDGMTSPISSNPVNWFTFSDLSVSEASFANSPLTPELPNYFIIYDLVVNTSDFSSLVGLGIQIASGTIDDVVHPMKYSGLGIIPAESIPESSTNFATLVLLGLGLHFYYNLKKHI
ncbi:hypothetical protein [Okeania sp. SIO2B3]|uniref:hypothetical protein n=1 Tax=Okeania sp. SIO2B3 TaxID=2607784 RepID=UPI0013C06C06|nr:hypothetical protein [Okeania sp. SIO2B3]NET44769.1 hypothetical protein [Okeania sp. SIO2B3]